MTARYQLSRLALDDLTEIVDYLREIDPLVALRFVEATQVTFDHLSHAPRAYPRFRSTDLRRRPLVGAFAKYLVFYRLNDDGEIIVARVLHSARDLNQEFGH